MFDALLHRLLHTDGKDEHGALPQRSGVAIGLVEQGHARWPGCQQCTV